MAITNDNQRGLLIVTSLEADGDPRFRELYRFLEASGSSMAELTLGHLYGTVRALSGADATTNGFVDALEELTSIPSIREVDVILNLHGTKTKLVFANKEITAKGLSDKIIEQVNASSRLRMLYSTACYGSVHAPHFINAGFTCASGAKAMNTNSPIEYPVFLGLWAAGKRFKTCINTAENRLGSIPYDTIAGIAFPEEVVDSNKDIYGNGYTTIRSTSN